MPLFQMIKHLPHTDGLGVPSFVLADYIRLRVSAFLVACHVLRTSPL